MPTRLGLSGIGHCVGSAVVRNEELAGSMGLPPTWVVDRTGIDELGNETVLLHVQTSRSAASRCTFGPTWL